MPTIEQILELIVKLPVDQQKELFMFLQDEFKGAQSEAKAAAKKAPEEIQRKAEMVAQQF